MIAGGIDVHRKFKVVHEEENLHYFFKPHLSSTY